MGMTMTDPAHNYQYRLLQAVADRAQRAGLHVKLELRAGKMLDITCHQEDDARLDEILKEAVREVS